VHFGVSTGNGDPLSSSSVNPNNSYRAILHIINSIASESAQDDIPREDSIIDLVDDPDGDPDVEQDDWRSKIEPERATDHYLCGLKLEIDEDNSSDDQDIVQVEYRWCKYGDWNQKSLWTKNDISEDEENALHVANRETMFSENKFVKSINAQYCRISANSNQVGTKLLNDALDVHAMAIACCDPDYCEESMEYRTVYAKKGVRGTLKGSNLGKIKRIQT